MTYIFLAWLNRLLCRWYGHSDFYEINLPEGLATLHCVNCGSVRMKVMDELQVAIITDVLERMKEEG